MALRATRGGSKLPSNALDTGLRLLGRRAHSRAELRRKLAQRRYSPGDVDTALTRLGELGYLDDRAFAAGLVRRRAASRGPMALSAELAQRGVSRDLADSAVAGFDTSMQLAAAVRLIERLYGSRQIEGYREVLDHVGSKLQRRGFSSAIVRAACRAVSAGTRQEPED